MSNDPFGRAITNFLNPYWENHPNQRDAVHGFMLNPTKQSAIIFAEYVDSFWYNHEMELYDSKIEYAHDEVNIVGTVMVLCDRFDDCDEIVKHDRYCINAEQLYNELLGMKDVIDNPEY